MCFYSKRVWFQLKPLQVEENEHELRAQDGIVQYRPYVKR